MRLCLALLFAAAPALAQGVFDPKKDFEQKLRSEYEKAAREHVTLAKFCAGKKLHAAALAEARRALAIDPSSTDAKKLLGWKFEGGAWVEDPAAVLKSVNEGTPDAVRKGMSEYEMKRLTAAGKSAKGFEELATWASKKNMKDEAKVAWRVVLFYNDGSDKARKECGWVEDGGFWVSPEDVAARAAEQKRIAGADGGAKVGEAHDYERKTGWSFIKRNSKHFHFMGMYSDSEMTALVKVAEAARLSFLELFELEAEALSAPIMGVFVKTKEDHDLFLEKCAELKGHDLDLNKAMSGWTSYTPLIFEVRQGERDQAFFADWTVHCVIELLWGQHFAGMETKAWLGEGVAYWFTYRMTKSAQTNCISFETQAQGGGGGWDDVLAWKSQIKEEVRAGRHAPMREIMEARVNGLDGPKGVKAWSVVEWMLAARRKEFMAFIKELEKGKKQEDALKEAFGVGYEGVDGMWSAYVQENY